MAKYKFVGNDGTIFGDFHYGVNATVEGVEDRDGQTVVLNNGDIFVTDTVVDHGLLEVVDIQQTRETVKVAPKPKKSNLQADAEVAPEPVNLEPSGDEAAPAPETEISAE